MDELKVFLGVSVCGFALTAATSSEACPTRYGPAYSLQGAVDDWLDAHSPPYGGICVAALNDKGDQGIGCRGMRTDTKKMGKKGLFQIGSLTKVFTAGLMARRLHDGDFGLYDLVSDYLPGTHQLEYDLVCALSPPSGGCAPIRFVDIGTHHSGLPRDEDSFLGNTTLNPADGVIQDYVNCVLDGSCMDTYGAYEYSNFAYSSLGYLMAENDGYDGDWMQDIQDTLLTPMSMTSTGTYEYWQSYDKPYFKKHAADGFTSSGNQGNQPDPKCPAHNPSGCAYSSITDMTAWLSYQMGLTNPNNTMRQMRDDYLRTIYDDGDPGVPNTYMGLAWRFEVDNACEPLPSPSTGSYTMVAKSGALAAQNSYMIYLQDPDDPTGVSKRGVVVLINYDGDSGALAEDLLWSLPKLKIQFIGPSPIPKLPGG